MSYLGVLHLHDKLLSVVKFHQFEVNLFGKHAQFYMSRTVPLLYAFLCVCGRLLY